MPEVQRIEKIFTWLIFIIFGGVKKVRDYFDIIIIIMVLFNYFDKFVVTHGSVLYIYFGNQLTVVCGEQI